MRLRVSLIPGPLGLDTGCHLERAIECVPFNPCHLILVIHYVSRNSCQGLGLKHANRPCLNMLKVLSVSVSLALRQTLTLKVEGEAQAVKVEGEAQAGVDSLVYLHSGYGEAS